MFKKIALTLSAAGLVFLVGCGQHTPPSLDEAVNNAQDKATQAGQDLQKQAQNTLAQWNAEANRYIADIKKNSKLDEQAKAWVEKTLADSQQMGRIAAARVAAAAGQADQQAKAWAETEIRKAIDQAVGQEKAQLQQILDTLLKPVTPAP